MFCARYLLPGNHCIRFQGKEKKINLSLSLSCKGNERMHIQLQSHRCRDRYGRWKYWGKTRLKMLHSMVLESPMNNKEPYLVLEAGEKPGWAKREEWTMEIFYLISASWWRECPEQFYCISLENGSNQDTRICCKEPFCQKHRGHDSTNCYMTTVIQVAYEWYKTVLSANG